MENKRILAIIFLILLLLLIFVPDLYNSYSVVEIKTIGVDFRVPKGLNVIGFNPDNDSLHLGRIPLNGVGKRNFSLFNDYDYALKVDIKSTGNASPYIFLSDNNFILESNETKDLRISAKPSLVPDTQPGNYSGELIIIFRKPLIS